MLKKRKLANQNNPDVILIGAGIMSATLGILLKELEPNLSITIYERLETVANESSNAWNNAGTGHSALCELNYTPQAKDGSIDCSKALKIFEQFQVSRQFWAYLVEKNVIQNPENFIHSIPHYSFVRDEENVDYLQKRFQELKKHHFFKNIEFSTNPQQIEEWLPLLMQNRVEEPIATSRIMTGTDVNFGNLTRILFQYLIAQKNVKLRHSHEVEDITQIEDGDWCVEVKNLATLRKKKVYTEFVFIGAGGRALTLLEKSGIEESKGFGGFPVSGQWLRCTNESVIEAHHAKVYGKASVGSPPMSVPHLDTRLIDGKKELLFGPYAGFSTRFLKQGSFFDLAQSINFSNILPMIQAGLDNLDLTKYLIEQVSQSPNDRMNALREYFPAAKDEDWILEVAGQRVQVIKNDPEEGGILEFGTEIVSSADGSIAALLGASPGASTSVSIMLDLLKRCFPENYDSIEWQTKLSAMIPSIGKSLAKDKRLFEQIFERTSKLLKLD